VKLVITATPNQARFAAILLRGPIDETFAVASQYGYDGIEIHLRNPDDVDLDKMVELSGRYSLPVTAVGTGMAARMDSLTFTDPSADVRSKAIDYMKWYIRFAKHLDADVIIGSFNGNFGIDDNEAKRRREYHLTCTKECCKSAAEVGVTLLLEPLNRYECDWLNTTQDALAVIEQAGSENLKYLADTYHMNIEQTDICESLRIAGSSLGYVHLVDSNRCGPGQGHLPVRDVLKTLIDIGYDGVLSFECLPEPDAESASKKSLEYVRGILAGLGRA